MRKFYLILAAVALIGTGLSASDSYAAGTEKKTAAKVSKVKWSAEQCRKRCDSVWMLGRERSVCYSRLCSKYPER